VLPKTKYQISGVGVSGQQHGMVALSSDLTPLRPAKLWCDVEAVEETAFLKEDAAKQGILDRSFLAPGFTSPKILWMKRNEPDLWEKTRWIVLPHDYVTMKLGALGQPITDAGDASGNGIFDTCTRMNSVELAYTIDPTLIDKLPTIIKGPNEIAGTLCDHYLQKLGLDHTKDQIPISVGSGDNMCSALGVGCVSPGQAVLSLGTSGTLFGVSNTPVSLNTPLAPFCDATGRHLPLACVMSCTGVLTQVLNEWCSSSSSVPWSHEEASQEAAKVPIGCHGITFLPYLGGERMPNWPHATGALLGLTPANLKYAQDPAVLYRACLEGITFLLADALQYFPESVDQLLVVGGGAKNSVWCQMIADILNCELRFPLEAESAALGAAFQAGAAATGTDVADYVRQQTIPIKPNIVEPENPEAYQDALEQYRRFGTALFVEAKD
jgi:xylulokinase